MTTDPLCKGCKRPTHPAYIDRYGGYCFDCYNVDVPERDGQIETLRQSRSRLVYAVREYRRELESALIEWAMTKDELELQRYATKALMTEVFGELGDNESLSIGNITALIRDLRIKNTKLQEALELYALEENWSSEGEYTYSLGVVNSNGGEDERTRTIELDSRTVFVGNDMGDDGGWKIAKDALESIPEI